MSAIILSVCKCSNVTCPEARKSCIQKKRISMCLDRSLQDRPVFARHIVVTLIGPSTSRVRDKPIVPIMYPIPLYSFALSSSVGD